MKRSINTVVFSTLPDTTPIGPWVKDGAPLPEGTEAGGSLALCCRDINGQMGVKATWLTVITERRDTDS